MCNDGDGKRSTESGAAMSREERLLAEYEAYIVTVARQKFPRSIVHPDRLADEIEEFAQRIRIKFWLSLQKQDIIAGRAYIRQIAATVSVDMIREHRPMLALPVNEDGELYQGNLLFTPRQEEQDPALLLAQEESYNDCAAWMAQGVLALPKLQQQAMLHSLKKRINDLQPLLEALEQRGADIQGATQPADTNQQRSQRTSLSIARKKMRAWHSRYDACCVCTCNC
ncbi:MAG TPA: hypothetical protein VKV40_21905 [Ktedonobacteraceae bacterium]|nr:hypothetical protein [Ktedonobacteraceae bacterium]